MALPSSPYCDSGTVALMCEHIVGDLPDFDANTRPKKAKVVEHCHLISVQIDSRLRMAGYKLPLSPMTDKLTGLPEEWPDSQTDYLKFVAALGVAAMITNVSIQPSFGGARGRDTEDTNSLWQLYYWELNRIFDLGSKTSTSMIRADHYPNTPAFRSLNVDYGAITDLSMGYRDPSRVLSLEAYTNFSREATKVLARDYGYDWTHAARIFGNQVGTFYVE